jgi:osmoprotectant transport system permease protein
MPSLLLADDPRNPWFSWQYVRKNLDSLTSALEQHVALTLAAVAVAALVAIPLAVLAYRRRLVAGPVLAVSGILYTIPSLALFTLLTPTLGLKFRTVLIGLVLYAIVIIVRNSLTGLRQVPADVKEAAQGMGYGPAALLWRIELPLALPSILTGLRLATVSTVALVTVGRVVGFGGFGNIILNGFDANFYKPPIMTGTLACIGLGPRLRPHPGGPGPAGDAVEPAEAHVNAWEAGLVWLNDPLNWTNPTGSWPAPPSTCRSRPSRCCWRSSSPGRSDLAGPPGSRRHRGGRAGQPHPGHPDGRAADRCSR